MNTEKTAMQELIEWINSEISLNPYYKASPRLRAGAKIVQVKAVELLKKEKQQIIDAYRNGDGNAYPKKHDPDFAEDYFNETFKNK